MNINKITYPKINWYMYKGNLIFDGEFHFYRNYNHHFYRYYTHQEPILMTENIRHMEISNIKLTDNEEKMLLSPDKEIRLMIYDVIVKKYGNIS